MDIQPVELDIQERDRNDFVRALEIIRQEQSASPSMLRQALDIHLLRIMDFLEVMERAGLVGPYHSIAHPRDVHLPRSGGH